MPPMTPEYIAYTNAPQIMAITGSFFAIALVVVLLRCYVRISMLKVFGIDDWIMVFSMVRLPGSLTLALHANSRFRCWRQHASYASSSSATMA